MGAEVEVEEEAEEEPEAEIGAGREEDADSSRVVFGSVPDPARAHLSGSTRPAAARSEATAASAHLQTEAEEALTSILPSHRLEIHPIRSTR